MDVSRTNGTPPSVEAAKLSPRQRQCLQLVYARRTSKEIAIELGIDRSTVDNYIADATRLMGARNRRDAAERLIMFQQQELTDQHPGIIEGHSSRVDQPSAPPSTTAQPRSGILPFRLPFRPKGAAHNELVTLERIAWIPLLSLAFATGFGLLAIGLRILSDLVTSVFRQ